MRAFITTIAGTFAPVKAFAASGLREDNSGIFVWVFLGFVHWCELFIAQGNREFDILRVYITVPSCNLPT
ncbi:MAG: hypothetical protein ACOYL3_06085 [Desulfuromonadaceae bacterium]